MSISSGRYVPKRTRSRTTPAWASQPPMCATRSLADQPSVKYPGSSTLSGGSESTRPCSSAQSRSSSAIKAAAVSDRDIDLVCRADPEGSVFVRGVWIRVVRRARRGSSDGQSRLLGRGEVVPLEGIVRDQRALDIRGALVLERDHLVDRPLLR